MREEPHFTPETGMKMLVKLNFWVKRIQESQHETL